MAETQKPEIALRYVGQGSFQPGVPARDLTADDLAVITEADKAELAAHEARVKDLPKDAEPPEAPPRRDRRWLVKTGLYEPVDVPAKEK